jgi:Protease inhibitor Inh
MAIFAPAAVYRRGPLVLFLLALSAGLAGCGSDRAASGPPVSATPRPPANAPPMAGRWTLSSAGGSCAMNFAGAAGAGEGTIAPEGGCPGNFFTSRKWSFEGEALVIKDHKGDKLAQLTIAGGGFQGQSTGGQAVSLSH